MNIQSNANTPADKNVQIKQLGFSADKGLGTLAKFGLIVLQSDHTIEHEFAPIFNHPQMALYHSRIANAHQVTPETLRQMELQMPIAASLLSPNFNFDVIGYGCTSGSVMIGEHKVTQIINAIHPQAKITNPISACKAALGALGLKNIGLVTPYSVEVTQDMRTNLQDAGFNIALVGSFCEDNDMRVAKISAQSILEAIIEIGKDDACDGVFVSCTSLRAMAIIAEAEQTIGKPVISSNQALAWHMLRLAGVTEAHNQAVAGAGRLFAS